MAGERARLSLWLVGAAGLMAPLAPVLLVLLMMGAGAVAGSDESNTFEQCRLSREARETVPTNYWHLYEEAAHRFDIDPAILAAIGRMESNHGRSTAVGVKAPTTNFHGCCAGPMQFCVIDGCPRVGSQRLTLAEAQHGTWGSVGMDGDGDGDKDPWDPADAIFSAAKYLTLSGAPGDYRNALLAYNRAEWYVDDVMRRAEDFRGACTTPTGSPGSVTRVSAGGPWLAEVPGTGIRCDARIVDNVAYLLERFHMALTACYAPTGHRSSGEHPLGLAIDVVPDPDPDPRTAGEPPGTWDDVMAAARFVGWNESCAINGCPNELARWIGYNGVPDHGDPEHCSGDCPAHLHISWKHEPARYNTRAAWVEVWRLPDEETAPSAQVAARSSGRAG
jgi:hypothetical protein